MRILAVNWQDRTNPRAGGAEVHLHEVLGRLALRGHVVDLLCSGYAGAASRELVDGISVHRIASRYGFAVAATGAFRRLARELAPDLVLEDVNKVPLYLPLFWRGPFVLLVPHLFGTTAFREVPWPIAAVVWASERPIPLVYRQAAVHAISRSTRADLVARGFDPGRIEVITPGVDSHWFAPDSAVPRFERPTFLYVGRLKRYKAVEVAIAALARLRAGGVPDAELLIAGAGDYRAPLEAAARRAGVGGAVRFLGFVSDALKRDLYRRAWAVVFPSPKEGWGITNVEAAACGTPAVASNSPGLAESVRDGETGLLVAHGDAVALAGALGRLALDSALRERLGRGARRFAERLSWERAADATEAQLERALAAKPGHEEVAHADHADHAA